ncbi:cysteine proteinase [Nadsonia fulvescens var. elongata DSM 6958]|uniref:Cysteine protease RIM13 n=1 Tax=Nadsonia fulvescens var. elongata DSM 6958 TaxID=857566 RepID=A0A1E3PRP9_9ASCO|nr:cysteine proteinase [Nadsonia fulvescens var. elongata DSM 6958]
MESNESRKAVFPDSSRTKNLATSVLPSNKILSNLRKGTVLPRFHTVPSDNFCEALYHHSLGQDDLALMFLAEVVRNASKIIEMNTFDVLTIRNLKELQSRARLVCDSIMKGNEVLNLSTSIAYISSKKNDLIFLPLVYDVDELDFSPILNEDQFRDPENEKYEIFLPKQKDLLKGWCRPFESSQKASSMGCHGSDTLYQEALSNCSFVASLCSIMAYNLRMNNSRIYPKLYPQDRNGMPTISVSGKYICNFFFNGVNRKVIIDDHLPVSNISNHSLHIKSASNPELLWPALLEKAYMKVMGGYDFKGSYAACDTFSLLGWIPEIILMNEYFQKDRSNTREKLWSRLLSSWKYGDVLLCLGTGKFLSSIGLDMGLIPEHDYAIIDLREEVLQDGTKRCSMLLQNPWNSSKLSSEVDINLENHTYSSNKGIGKFWTSFESVCFEFQSLYLNWNPSLFVHYEVTHFLWGNAQQVLKHNMIYQNPQYTVSNKGNKEMTVWLLLCRHSPISKTHGTSYMTIHLYNSNGSKIYTPDEKPILNRGTSMNTPYYLLPFTLPGKSSYTALVSVSDFDESNSQNKDSNTLRFSLLTYATSKNIRVEKSKHELQYKAFISGEWNSFTAGGSWSTASYSSNPQFQLTLLEPTSDLRIYLSSECDSAVSIQLFYTPKGTIFNFDNKLVIGASNNYKQHNAFIKKAGGAPLQPGKYTIIPSTFDVGVCGNFKLMCFADRPIFVAALPGIMAGLFLRHITKSWNNNKVIRIPFYLERNSRLVLHVTTYLSNDKKPDSNCGLLIRLSLFSPEDELVGVSNGGSYSDTSHGLFLDADIQLRKPILNCRNFYIILVERLIPGNEEIRVTIGSEVPVKFDV